ncbi:hypothetical protein VTH06DRAFT_5216 [Thermothelomyces fergusii]
MEKLELIRRTLCQRKSSSQWGGILNRPNLVKEEKNAHTHEAGSISPFFPHPVFCMTGGQNSVLRTEPTLRLTRSSTLHKLFVPSCPNPQLTLSGI